MPKLETAPKPETIQRKSRKHVNNRGNKKSSSLHVFVIFTVSFQVLELFLVLAPTGNPDLTDKKIYWMVRVTT